MDNLIVENKPFVDDYQHNILDFAKKKYPNAVSVPVCAFGIHHSIYEDDSYIRKIAETKYTNIEVKGTFTGVKLIFNFIETK